MVQPEAETCRHVADVVTPPRVNDEVDQLGQVVFQFKQLALVAGAQVHLIASGEDEAADQVVHAAHLRRGEVAVQARWVDAVTRH